ncbi:MAG: hypothetical protein WC523_05380 [Patescibacteria group bacterium]|jgi:hypothetical protein
MFNNLNDQNQIKPPVDDIFAETDKSPEGPNGVPNSEIETRQVGLTSTSEMAEETNEKKGLGKWFKIILILIAVTIVILSGYLVYSKFFSSPAAAPNDPTVKNEVPSTIIEEKKATSSLTTENTSPNTSSLATNTLEIPNAPETISTTTSTMAEIISQLDTDSDGLTDEEERLAGTNPKAIDTDSDDLSDYEEVKIYRTNPLIGDTDGDGYLDGAEVKSGYNPNGSGKMPGATTTVF